MNLIKTKIPLAWLQITREKVRLLVALAGISFACILMFMQLGFRDGLFDSATTFHKALQGDIFMVSPQSTALIAMRSFSERRLYQMLGLPGVESIVPIYVDFRIWKNPETCGTSPQVPSLKQEQPPDPNAPPSRCTSRGIMIIGADPDAQVFDLEGVAENIGQVKLPDVVLFDKLSRSEFGPVPELMQEGKIVTTEVGSRRITVGGLFALGASFGADGNLLTSDLNFTRIFNRKRGIIDIGMVKLQPGSDLGTTLNAIQQNLPGEFKSLVPTRSVSWVDSFKSNVLGQSLKPQLNDDFSIGDIRVMTKEKFIEFEKSYWQSGTAIGFIFTLGTAMGFIVGIVIVYQILYTDVTDHLAEYATLKAMGYSTFYLLGVVFQEALILAVLGFIPGFVLANFLYAQTRTATLLPVIMTFDRTLTVFTLALVMCFVSGAIAVRKLQAADPADIF